MDQRATKPKKSKKRQYNIDTRERLIKVAEKLFSQQGYSATSLRQITTEAKVNIALVHYHFESKANLFMEVYMRCGKALITERIRLLDEAEKIADKKPIPIEDIIKAFFMPALYMMTDRSGSGKNYVRLATRLHNEPSKLAKAVLSKVFDASTVRFIEAIQKSLPKLAAEDVYWRLFFMIGVFIYTVSDSGRLEAISKGKCSSNNFDEAIKQITPFLVAGFNTPALK
ncbi:TetR/AcrR family transcriptional regulator [Pseudomonadota bacterium]